LNRFLFPLLAALLLTFFSCEQKTAETLPNILWITSEDMEPLLGAYGDSYASTPHLDRLADKCIKFTHAYANAAVCSPARSTIITGAYASSLGTMHLRSDIAIPSFITPFPKLLRAAGYYCSNNQKEDYNFSDTTIWNESGAEAHWRNREANQPFFSVFNLEITHQSKVFGSDSVFKKRILNIYEPDDWHDPALAPLPPYYPEDSIVCKMVARYYDNVSAMDHQVYEILEQLKQDGLEDRTIVFFYSDHGTGLPGGKRALYDMGTRVPLLIHVPEQYAHLFPSENGSIRQDLVSFIDLAPTVLDLAGVGVPDYMPGKPLTSPPSKEPVYGFADRVDEGYELSRSVRMGEYLYIRNFMPELPLIQPNFYTDQSAIMQALTKTGPKLPNQVRSAFGRNDVRRKSYTWWTGTRTN